MKTTIQLTEEELQSILDHIQAEFNSRLLSSRIDLTPVEEDLAFLADDGAPQPRTWRAAR